MGVVLTIRFILQLGRAVPLLQRKPLVPPSNYNPNVALPLHSPKSTSPSASNKRITAFQRPRGASLLHEYNQLGDVFRVPRMYVVCKDGI